jgi:hypothetical protein
MRRTKISPFLICISLNSILRTGLAGSTYRTPIRGILSAIAILQ